MKRWSTFRFLKEAKGDVKLAVVKEFESRSDLSWSLDLAPFSVETLENKMVDLLFKAAIARRLPEEGWNMLAELNSGQHDNAMELVRAVEDLDVSVQRKAGLVT